MKYTIFVSWQSDKPLVKNKIFNCLEGHKKKLNFKIDQATRDTPGSPKIEDTIFEKIKNCDIFLADITPIVSLNNKQIPNPNVVVELGFAIKTLGWKRIILVAEQDDTWKIEQLPFDINHHRIGTFKPNEPLNLSFELETCLNVCHSNTPKGFIFSDGAIDQQEKTNISRESVIYFHQRMGQGFPNVRGRQEFTNKKEIHNHLNAFFNCTLKFEEASEGCSTDPIWWFRGSSNLPIDNFEIIDNDHVLLGTDELNIKKIIVYSEGTGAYYRDYIYLELNPDSPTGLYENSKDDEEYAVFQPTYNSKTYKIKRNEYDSGAAEIEGDIINLEGRAKLRLRHLRPYNLIIVPKFSPCNCREFDIKSLDYFNGLLDGSVKYEDFHNFIMSLERKDPEH